MQVTTQRHTYFSSKTTRKQEDVRTSSVCFAKIRPRPDVLNNVREGIPRDALCLRRNCTHIVGSQKTHYCDDRQQSINYPLLPVKADPTETVESLRPSTTVRFCACPRTRYGEPSCRLFVSTRHQPGRQASPENKWPVHYMEIDLAAKTPKQDDDEEEYDPEQQQPETIDPHIPSRTTNTSVTTTVSRWSRSLVVNSSQS